MTQTNMAQGKLFAQVLDPANRANPYPLYARLRETPVALQEDGSYVVSTYREIGALLHDPRISSDERKSTQGQARWPPRTGLRKRKQEYWHKRRQKPARWPPWPNNTTTSAQGQRPATAHPMGTCWTGRGRRPPCSPTSARRTSGCSCFRGAARLRTLRTWQASARSYERRAADWCARASLLVRRTRRAFWRMTSSCCAIRSMARIRPMAQARPACISCGRMGMSDSGPALPTSRSSSTT